ncbi:kinase-like protein [Phanerochaete sordida]|uniref:non-specific serine/threonine protein kinase n=1 Tax=Phanerochaete sordida TaxID=48140 RepID=A0A9P3LD98_9APHY|nr:kinase-like protein [Phanerochaete sordida]
MPISIGECLGEYRVLRKLGWGNYSTVWLVQRERDKCLAAAKVMTESSTRDPDLHELEFLQCMRTQQPLHAGYPHVTKLIDHFRHPPESESHLCLVTEPLSENLLSFSARWKKRRLPVPLVKHVTRQVLMGLDYLHNVCNIIHTDMKNDNIMFAMTDADIIASAADKGERLKSVDALPDGTQVTRYRSAPIRFRLPEGHMDSPDTWSHVTAKIGDVGVSCWADKRDRRSVELIQSSALRAPEVCIGAGWGKPVDIWSMGCIVFELLTGKSLIEPNTKDLSIPNIHMIMFGDYPKKLVERGQFSEYFFNDDCTPRMRFAERCLLEDIIKGTGIPDAPLVTDFLLRMFALDPAERASCHELREHKWLA